MIIKLHTCYQAYRKRHRVYFYPKKYYSRKTFFVNERYLLVAVSEDRTFHWEVDSNPSFSFCNFQALIHLRVNNKTGIFKYSQYHHLSRHAFPRPGAGLVHFTVISFLAFVMSSTALFIMLIISCVHLGQLSLSLWLSLLDH